MGDMQRSIRFPDDLDARIAKLAADEDRAFSWIVVRAMERALGDAPRATESRERPAPPRSPAKTASEKVSDAAAPSADAPRVLPSGDPAPSRRQTARTPSPLAARQQALNKSKGM